MKQLKLLVALFYLFLISSCGSSSGTTQNVNPQAQPHIKMHEEFIKEENQKTMNEKLLKEISGTYTGNLPCNDCEKIVYKLQLDPDETYQATVNFVGKNNGPVIKNGTFSITDKLQIVLDDHLAGLNKLKISESGLQVLDKNGKVYTGELAARYLLQPVTNDKVNSISPGLNRILQKKWEKGIDFYAFGNEPFWSLDMDLDKTIHFKNLDEIDFTAPAVQPDKAMDTNVERFRSVTESGEIIVEIKQYPCADNMSGEAFDFTVNIDFKKPGDSNYQTFKGCGNYVPDYRLHDIWAIVEVNGLKVDLSNYKKKVPTMEINISRNTVLGNDGCNSFNGSVSAAKGKIKFGQLASTLMMCIHNLNITNILSGKTLDYKFDKNLEFYSGARKVMELKHID